MDVALGDGRSTVLGNQIDTVVQKLLARAADGLLVQPAARVVAKADTARRGLKPVRVVVGVRVRAVAGQIAATVVGLCCAVNRTVLIEPIGNVGIGEVRVGRVVIGAVGVGALYDLVGGKTCLGVDRHIL